MRTIAVLGFVGAAAVATAFVSKGNAADLGPLYPTPAAYAEPDGQLEFGTGWYLRGDAAFEPKEQGVANATALDFQHHDWDYAVGGGIGYKFNSFLRADMTGEYVAPVWAQGTYLANNGSTVTARASLQRYDAMANLYIDLGTWYGLTPYIGGGAGFGVFDPTFTVNTTAGGATTVVRTRPSNDTQFAWAAMAGVSYQIDQNAAIDIGYRHLELGRFSATIAGYSIDHRFTEDQVRVGLRYMIY